MTDRTVVYRCVPSVNWLRDRDAIRLVDAGSARSWAFHGTDAIVWDLIATGYQLPQVSRMLAVIRSVSPLEAAALVSDMLRNWETQGLVAVSPGENHG